MTTKADTLPLPIGLVSKFARVVDQSLFVLLMLAYVAATLWPAAGKAIRSQHVLPFPVPLLLLAVLLFLSGLSIDREQLGNAFRQRWLLLTGQLVMWAVPCLVVVVLWQLSAAWPVGLIAGLGLVAVTPAAASSVAWSQLSRGNIAVSLGLLTISTLLSPLLIAAFYYLNLTSRGLAFESTGATIVELIAWIIPAVIAGGVVRWFAGTGRITALRPFIRLFSAAVLLLLNYANASLALPQVFHDFQGSLYSTLATIVVIVASAGFFGGLLLTRLVRADAGVKQALVYGVGMKNTGMALVLAGIWLETVPLATVVVVVYTLVQHLLAAAYHQRLAGESDSVSADEPAAN